MTATFTLSPGLRPSILVFFGSFLAGCVAGFFGTLAAPVPPGAGLVGAPGLLWAKRGPLADRAARAADVWMKLRRDGDEDIMRAPPGDVGRGIIGRSTSGRL